MLPDERSCIFMQSIFEEKHEQAEKKQ